MMPCSPCCRRSRPATGSSQQYMGNDVKVVVAGHRAAAELHVALLYSTPAIRDHSFAEHALARVVANAYVDAKDVAIDTTLPVARVARTLLRLRRRLLSRDFAGRGPGGLRNGRGRRADGYASWCAAWTSPAGLEVGRGFIPRWWVAEPDTFLLYATSAADNSESSWSSSPTLMQKMSGGRPQGEPVALTSAGGFHDGRSRDDVGWPPGQAPQEP